MKKFAGLFSSLLVTIVIGTSTRAALSQSLEIAAVAPIPSPRQLSWHAREYYAFVHFNMNTFTDREWGEGKESPETFLPTDLDCRQWAQTVKDAGMSGIIITAKHHDGFCLWPTAFSEHSVKKSRWKNGKGDVLRELSEACREFGLWMGVYLSPWDRNSALYGQGDVYNEYFKNQLREVLIHYGTIKEVWFDGACGEGQNGKRQTYDWNGFINVVRTHAPEAVIFSDAGPDIRWIGNERGIAGQTNWAMLNRREFYPGIPQKEGELNSGHEDGDDWLPGECDVSIRPGWYFHAAENDKVKSLADLRTIYLASVGRGSNLLLNLPVDRRGRVHEADVARLKEFKAWIDRSTSNDLLRGAAIECRGGIQGERDAAHLVDGRADTFACLRPTPSPKGPENPQIRIRLRQPTKADLFEIGEPIAFGQRVKKYKVSVRSNDTDWEVVVDGRTIGRRRLEPFVAREISEIMIEITECRSPAAAEKPLDLLISHVALYLENQ